MSKSIIIIGAGMAGLSAGCYGRMNDYQTIIFELHDKPGGLCTSWQRKGYTVDGCIHWLVGSGPGINFHQIWQELGAIQGREYIDHEEFGRVQDPSGKALIIYTNVDRLEKHLLELSPADEKPIKEFTGAIRKFMDFDLPLGKPSELESILDKAKTYYQMAPYLYPFVKWGKLSLEKFAKRFQDPFLRKSFSGVFGFPDFPMAALILTLAWMSKKTAGYPIGGSLEFARAIGKRYLDLGGKVWYKSRVEKILTEDNCAIGIRLADGTEHRADFVISAADGYATIFKMLEGKYLDEEIKERYEKLPIFKSLVQVALGVNRDLSKEPSSVSYLLEKPITVAGEDHDKFSIMNYAFDPCLAPAGKTVLVCRFLSDINHWREMARDQERYETEKQKIADLVIGMVEQRYPGISENVEMVDVATPLTFERYTGNWQGSMEGWLMTTKTIMMRMKRTLPGLDNFFMIGQWVQPGGGLPPGALHGREIIQLICAQDQKQFTATKP